MTDEAKREKGQSVPVRLVVILGATLASLIVFVEVAFRTLGTSADKNADHYYELVTAIVKQMERQHQDSLTQSDRHHNDFMAAQAETRKTLAELAEEQRSLDGTFRTAYHLPPRAPKTAARVVAKGVVAP